MEAQQVSVQCHVCKHLGQTQCRYVSHKKYRAQKGNQSFRIGDLVKRQSIQPESYLKSLQEKKIQFQFPSLQVPSVQGSPCKVFERTLIEKVLQERTPIKLLNTGSRSLIDAQTQNRNPSNAGFSYQQRLQLPKADHRINSFYRPYIPYKSDLSPIELQQNQKQALHYPPKRSIYNFTYGTQDYKKQNLNPKVTQNQNSFLVEESKYSTHKDYMVFSRLNQHLNSINLQDNFYKEYLAPQCQRRDEMQNLKRQNLSQFKYHSEVDRYSAQKTWNYKTEAITTTPIHQLQVKGEFSTERYTNCNQKVSQQISWQMPQKRYGDIHSSSSYTIRPSNYSKNSISTNQNQNLHQKIYSQNQMTSLIKRQNQNNSKLNKGQQKLFYPIYPVYQVVYQLQRVIPFSQGQHVSRVHKIQGI